MIKYPCLLQVVGSHKGCEPTEFLYAFIDTFWTLVDACNEEPRNELPPPPAPWILLGLGYPFSRCTHSKNGQASARHKRVQYSVRLLLISSICHDLSDIFCGIKVK